MAGVGASGHGSVRGEGFRNTRARDILNEALRAASLPPSALQPSRSHASS